MIVINLNMHYNSTVTVLKITATSYSSTTLSTDIFSSFDNVQWLHSKDSILWIDVSDYAGIEELSALEKNLRLHPLALEDCINIRQRPKVEEYGENLFLVSRMVLEKDGLYSEGPQLGIFIGNNFVVTIHREILAQLDNILKDLKKGKLPIVSSSPSFLLYALLDTVVDNLEDAVREVDEAETILGRDVLKEPPGENVLKLIQMNRTNLLLLRRLMRSQSDVLCRLAGKKYQLVDREIEAFIRDTYDHTLRTLDRIDNLLEINMGSLNIYSSSFSNRMNETMRFLAVISTIGVPLTVLVGWYGMNFNAMPEVYWTYGYFMVILLAVTMITATFLFFRRKRWL